MSLRKSLYLHTIIIILSLASGGIILLLLLSLWNKYHDDLDLAHTNSSYITELMGANTQSSLEELSDILLGIKLANSISNLDSPHDQDQSNFDVAIKKADRALYVAKNNGRDRVVLENNGKNHKSLVSNFCKKDFRLIPSTSGIVASSSFTND